MSTLKPWLFVVTLLFYVPALAAVKPAVDIQLFVPAPESKGFFTTESAEVNKHLVLSLGANLSYGHGLLEVVNVNPDNSQQTVGDVVANRADLNLLAALGLYGRGQLGIAVPLVWQNGFDGGDIEAAGINLGTQSLRAVTLGNVRLLPKLNLVHVKRGTFAVALLPTLVIPTAGSSPYVGEAGLVFAPEVALSGRLGPTRLGLDLGFRWRKSVQLIQNVTVGNELFFKAAAAFDLGLGSSKKNPVELIVEAFGNTPPKAIFGWGNKGVNATLQETLSPMEVDVGLRIVLGAYIITFGGGGGVLPGYGAPAPRLFVGATYYSGRSILPEHKQEGLVQPLGKCPTKEQEDADDSQDVATGCPDPDNDDDEGVIEESVKPKETGTEFKIDLQANPAAPGQAAPAAPSVGTPPPAAPAPEAKPSAPLLDLNHIPATDKPQAPAPTKTLGPKESFKKTKQVKKAKKVAKPKAQGQKNQKDIQFGF